MRNIQLAAATAAFLVLGAGAAAAQDWSGPYIGLSVGGAMVDDDEDERVVFDTNLNGSFDDTVRNAAGVDAFGPTTANPGGFCGGKALANNFTSGCIDDDGIGTEFSARVGYDLQSGAWVYGAVLEASSVDVEDFATAFSTTPAAYQFNRDLDDVMYAARLRVGRSFGRSLVYATGGAAMAKVTDTFFTTNGANSFAPLTSEDDATGYQLGFGGEMWVSDRVTLGAEYLYTSLDAGDGLTVRTGPGTAPATNPFLITNAAGTDQRRSSEEIAFHGFRLTLAARF
ncbi:MAG TPA: outer membrane beta-barrel protein [Brevundimonas sp.]|nr:outer membrane beta-barrel protein [Brevundimonas sp.]